MVKAAAEKYAKEKKHHAVRDCSKEQLMARRTSSG